MFEKPILFEEESGDSELEKNNDESYNIASVDTLTAELTSKLDSGEVFSANDFDNLDEKIASLSQLQEESQELRDSPQIEEALINLNLLKRQSKIPTEDTGTISQLD